MRVLPKPGVINQLQQEMNMNDQQFAEYIGTSRVSIWRAKLPTDSASFSFGQEVMAKILMKFPKYSFEELFFLERVSHECYIKNKKIRKARIHAR